MYAVYAVFVRGVAVTCMLLHVCSICSDVCSMYAVYAVFVRGVAVTYMLLTYLRTGPAHALRVLVTVYAVFVRGVAVTYMLLHVCSTCSDVCSM